MEVYNYKPRGVCSTNIKLEIENNHLVDIIVTGGCSGNLEGIRRLIKGMDLDNIVEKLKGTCCSTKQTSCPDQIASAILEYKGEFVK